jgi:PAS domain-containing protein
VNPPERIVEFERLSSSFPSLPPIDQVMDSKARPSSVNDEAAAQPAAECVDSLAGLVDLAIAPSLTVAMQSVREVLGMDVAYVSEVVGDDMVFREVAGDAASFGIRAGLSMPLRLTYCQRMLDGRLPNLIPDVRGDDRAASVPMTWLGRVGAFATVPLTLSDGRLYGTLCAAGRERTRLDFRSLQFLKVLARMVADQLEREAGVRELSHLAALVDTADDAILGMTPHGLVTSWNPACERIYGYSADEAIGRDIVDLIALPGQENRMRETLRAVAPGPPAHQCRGHGVTNPRQERAGELDFGDGPRHLPAGPPGSFPGDRTERHRRACRRE